MTAVDTKRFYTRFLEGHKNVLHFAAHSHHFWPDVSREAQLEYWDDCACLSDEKWSKIFDVVIPKAQKHVAKNLNLLDPSRVVFAPNTHELVARILSCFQGKISILTTNHEFYSLRRQLLRYSELPDVSVTFAEPGDLKGELKKKPDLLFVSQVFFDSGYALTVDELADLISPDTVTVIDGYHAFSALPVDLSRLEGKVFYLGGGYKYAQAGEGVGFAVVPDGQWRPANTGWFAEYADLKRPAAHQVGYAADARAFLGATQDPSGLYRFNAVWDLFENEHLSIARIHDYVRSLQIQFIQGLPQDFCKINNLEPLFDPQLEWHGHFLTFRAATEELAGAFLERLKHRGVLIDRRGTNLRFGFGLYQNADDISRLISKIL